MVGVAVGVGVALGDALGLAVGVADADVLLLRPDVTPRYTPARDVPAELRPLAMTRLRSPSKRAYSTPASPRS